MYNLNIDNASYNDTTAITLVGLGRTTADEVGNFNFNYAMKFINCYFQAAKNIADNPTQPKWKKGDEFEEALKSLHQVHFFSYCFANI